jgi:hypothetical protein
MLPIVRGMKDPEIIQLAEHFSKLPAKGMESGNPDPALMKIGAEKGQGAALRHLPYGGLRRPEAGPPPGGAARGLPRGGMRAYRDGKRTGGDTIWRRLCMA